jgi:hypothetical protein
VIGLTVFHVFLSRAARRFAGGANQMTARQWRMANEIPTVSDDSGDHHGGHKTIQLDVN